MFEVKNDAPLPLDRIRRERRQGGYPFMQLKNKGEYIDMEAHHFDIGEAIEERLRKTKNAARQHCRNKGGDIFVEMFPEEEPTTIRIWCVEPTPGA